jgi:iron-sulfur cluster assembly protein
MALDEPKESDDVFTEDGIKYLIDRELLKDVDPVLVDFVSTAAGGGFKITSKLTEKSTCGSCSSC